MNSQRFDLKIAMNVLLRPNALVNPTCVVEPTTWQALPAMLLVERSGFGLNELLGAKPGAVSHELLTCEKRQAAIQEPAEQRRQPDNWAVHKLVVHRVDLTSTRGKIGISNKYDKTKHTRWP